MNAPNPVPQCPSGCGWSVEHFLLLDESGALDDYAKTELIDGDIYVMNAQHHPHARAKSRLTMALNLRLREIGSDLEAVSEVSVRVSDDTMPEPDIVLSPWSGSSAVPVESVALVVEVSDSTLGRDLGRKLDLYAAAGIPEYWVLDLTERRVLIHHRPDADGYHGQRDVPLGEALVSATVEGLTVDSARLVD